MWCLPCLWFIMVYQVFSVGQSNVQLLHCCLLSLGSWSMARHYWKVWDSSLLHNSEACGFLLECYPWVPLAHSHPRTAIPTPRTKATKPRECEPSFNIITSGYCEYPTGICQQKCQQSKSILRMNYGRDASAKKFAPHRQDTNSLGWSCGSEGILGSNLARSGKKMDWIGN